MSELTYLERQIAKARQLCDFLSDNLSAFGQNQPYLSGISASNYYSDDEMPDGTKIFAKDQIVSVMRALRKDTRITKTEKEYANAQFTIRLTLSSGAYLTLQADRETVCTKKVTGTETKMVRDYDAAPMVEKTVDIVEWECAPILDTV